MPSITINLTAAQTDRLRAAFTERLERDPTLEDLKQYIIDDLKRIVREYEVIKARRDAVSALPPPASFDPT